MDTDIMIESLALKVAETDDDAPHTGKLMQGTTFVSH
jgi:hypothetical protein